MPHIKTRSEYSVRDALVWRQWAGEHFPHYCLYDIGLGFVRPSLSLLPSRCGRLWKGKQSRQQVFCHRTAVRFIEFRAPKMKRSPAADKTFDVRLPSAIASDLFWCGFRAVNVFRMRRNFWLYQAKWSSPFGRKWEFASSAPEEILIYIKLERVYCTEIRDVKFPRAGGEANFNPNASKSFVSLHRGGKFMSIAMTDCTSRRAHDKLRGSDCRVESVNYGNLWIK